MRDDGALAHAALEVLHRQHGGRVLGPAPRQGAEMGAHGVDLGQRIALPAAGLGVALRRRQAAGSFGVADRLLGAAHHLGRGLDIEAQIQRLLVAGGVDARAQGLDHPARAAGEPVQILLRHPWQHRVHSLPSSADGRGNFMPRAEATRQVRRIGDRD